MSFDHLKTSLSQPSEAIANEFKRALNAHGYAFQDTVASTICSLNTSKWCGLLPVSKTPS